MLSALLVMAMMAPRELLDVGTAAMCMFSILFAKLEILLDTDINNETVQGLMYTFAVVLTELDKTDVAAVRAERSVPRVVARLARWLRAVPRHQRIGYSSPTTTVMNLLVLFGASWEFLADKPDALQELVNTAVREEPEETDKHPYQLQALILCCYVGKAALLSGAARIFAPLLRGRPV
eukprot:TRINITY_DN3485_c2_g1_i1.p2 TRINITY_DN3485_c2_g1~~TRINITY_DN3485_c2_g1_i1.p2  ORF type:complete len:179 (-),score=33.96 TRINITY_DN3485_c2_g1_i1:1060-1596(-)